MDDALLRQPGANQKLPASPWVCVPFGADVPLARLRLSSFPVHILPRSWPSRSSWALHHVLIWAASRRLLGCVSALGTSEPTPSCSGAPFPGFPSLQQPYPLLKHVSPPACPLPLIASAHLPPIGSLASTTYSHVAELSERALAWLQSWKGLRMTSGSCPFWMPS